MQKTIYDFTAKDITGKERSLGDYKGKTLVIVNTASKCGFTPQYKDLQELYSTYKDQGLEILGFPCNQFGGQEPEGEAQISSFCELNFGVKFPLFSKVDVNGNDTHPLFAYLKEELPGIAGTKAVKWNFTKFIIDKNGKPVQRLAPNDGKDKIENVLKEIL